MTGRVVVIGGGVGGLAAAALAARGGAQVTLLERHDHVGGRVGRLGMDGFTFDTGPSWYFMPEVIEHLFALLGERVSDHLDLVPLDPVYRLFPEPAGPGPATPVDLVADPAANAATFEALEPGAGEAVRRYAESATEAYQIALDRFLYTTFARPDRALSWPLLARSPRLARLLTRSLHDEVAGAVDHPVLRQMLGYHAVFLGSSPHRVPALYSLMSHLDLVAGVAYPRGGMYALVTALERVARAQGVEIRTGVEVTGIEVDPVARSLREPRRTGVARGVRLAGGELVPADVVIDNGDLHRTETALLAPAHRSLPEPWWSGRGPGVSALVVMAGVRGTLPELAHHSLFFNADWPGTFEAILGPGRATPAEALRVPGVASLYVARPSATDPGVAPPGHETLFVLVPFPADPRIGAGPAGSPGRVEAEALADRYLDQVGAWAGVPDLRARVVTRRVVAPADYAHDLHAWRGAAIGMEHTLAQSAMFRPGNVSPRVPNLLRVGGGTVPGVGLPMVAISAELAVKRLLGETSAHPLPGPLRPGFLAAARPGGVWARYGGAGDGAR